MVTLSHVHKIFLVYIFLLNAPSLTVGFIYPQTKMAEKLEFCGRFSLVASMSAYHKERLEEEKKAKLEQRRERLRSMLQEERDRLEAELRDLVPERSEMTSQWAQKAEELRKAREERRKKVITLNNRNF